MTTADSASGQARRRRGGARWVLVVLLAVPLLEIMTIIAVGQAVGAWWTFGALIVLSVVGAWLVHREGRRTWRRLKEALQQGATPAKELTDAALVLVGGAMLLTPGFLTDALGLFFVLPLTRPVTRVWLQAVVASRLLGHVGGSGSAAGRSPTRPPGSGQVIEGEIVSDPDQPPQT